MFFFQFLNHFKLTYFEVFKEELKFFLRLRTHVKAVPARKSSPKSDSSNKSSSKSRSDGNINTDSIGFRMSLKNLHKIPSEDAAFDKF